MTVTTDTGRHAELLADARQKYEGQPLPSTTQMAKDLRTHFNNAKPVRQTLISERDQAEKLVREERRRAVSRMGRRKRNGSVPVTRPRLVLAPSAPVSAPPAEAVDIALDAPAPEVVEKDPEPVAETPSVERRKKPVATWPIFLLTLPAFVAIWGGWVDLGQLTGFGTVYPFPGIPVLEKVDVNLAITLPIGLETYAAYALYVWLSIEVAGRARTFAMWSAIGSLALGAAGQVTYHLLKAAGITQAPWQITTIVACLPVAVLGMGTALRHLVKAEEVNE